MTSSEKFLREFHTARPGVTARAFGRAGPYARFAARVPPGARVLDLACGDGELLVRLDASAVGIDLTIAELSEARARLVRTAPLASETREPRLACARAQRLPFAASSFDVVTCHLAFMLFEDLPAVVRELERVLVPGGRFLALLGGGPTAGGDDAFHRFVDLLGSRSVPRLGDPRAKSEAGWRELMPHWRIEPFERWELDLAGTFDEVWAFLGASYEVDPERASALRSSLSVAAAEWGERIPCTAVVYFAQASVLQTT